jgi:hypothetical protein
MEYVRVVDKAELPTNKMTIVVVGGKEVLLANRDGCGGEGRLYENKG